MKGIFIIALLSSVAVSIPVCASTSTPDAASFGNPPRECLPRVWWHWEDGNVAKDGIRKDLEWMDRSGIGGFHHFDAGLSQAPVVSERLIYMREDWRDAFRYALHIADSLDMTVGIASSPGWSNTGGPWVSRDDAMKKLVWSAVDVEGGSVDAVIPNPEAYDGYYRDIAVVAFPLPESDGALKSVRVEGNGGRQMWNVAPYEYNLALEARGSDDVFRKVASIPQTTASAISVNFGPVYADSLRLVNADGTPSGLVFEVFDRTRISHAEEKAGFSSPYDLDSFVTTAAPAESFAGCDDVRDISAMFDSAAGRLTWNAPSGGRWRIIRFGYTLTGRRNGPAPAEATGLEVDKLDSAAYHDYFIKYLDMYSAALGGPLGERGVDELLVDSYEAGWQTWTPRMVGEFGRRRGYGLVKWMPVLAGEILDSPGASEKFLFDWRRTIGDLHAANYGRIKDIAASYGVRGLCLESQENGRVFVADGMSIKRTATVPMAACWTSPGHWTTHSTPPIAVADIRESASVSHLYGTEFVAAESFTTDGFEGTAYSFTPERLKRLADMEFASGVNRIFIHESSHQPLDDCRPGLGLLIYGQWFSRHETWAEMSGPWLKYLARTSYMLSRGSNVADVLVYYGEDANVTARYGLEPFACPDGYNYDFINADGLADLKVKDGRVVALSGASYAVLCLDNEGLPESDEARSRIADLVAAGAAVCAPEGLEATLGTATQKDLDAPSQIRYVHRTAGGTQIYWLDNPADSTLEYDFSFRDGSGSPSLWDPESGRILPLKSRRKDGRRTVHLKMSPDDAFFVVFASEAGRLQETSAVSEYAFSRYAARSDGNGRGMDLTGWTASFPERTVGMDSLRDYTAFDDEYVKYFSGTCVYSTCFDLDSKPSEAILDLGEVCDLCRVRVNGVDCGVLWRAPFLTDIAPALRRGENRIEVEVANVWVNRLIGDMQPDCPKVTTYSTTCFFKPDSPLRPAGLKGPVRLF